jgi:hypothetical protein
LRLFAYSGVQHILCCVFCFLCLRLVFCVPNVTSFSGLPILVQYNRITATLIFWLSCLCPLTSLHSNILTLNILEHSEGYYRKTPYTLNFLCLRLVFCVPNVTSFSGLPILDCLFGVLYRLFSRQSPDITNWQVSSLPQQRLETLVLLRLSFHFIYTFNISLLFSIKPPHYYNTIHREWLHINLERLHKTSA